MDQTQIELLQQFTRHAYENHFTFMLSDEGGQTIYIGHHAEELEDVKDEETDNGIDKGSAKRT